jgi:hypothetical protein
MSATQFNDESHDRDYSPYLDPTRPVQRKKKPSVDPYDSDYEGDDPFLGDQLFANLQKNAEDRRKSVKNWRFFGTIGLVVTSSTIVGGFALLVKLDQAPPEQGVQLSDELANELQAQADWLQFDQRVDTTAQIAPLKAEPGYRQTLAMSLGAKLRTRIQSRLIRNDDECNVVGGDVASCAYIIERKDVDKIRDLGLAGKMPFLVHIENGKVDIIRQLSQEEVLDWSNFNKQALDAAISQVNINKPIDPFKIDQKRDQLIEARINRLEAEQKTDAAQRIRQAAIGLSRIQSLPTQQQEVEAAEQEAREQLEFQQKQREYLLRKEQMMKQQELTKQKAELKQKQNKLKNQGKANSK